MANYYAASRTNTFRVRDPAAFRVWAEKLGLEIIERADGSGYALFPGESTDSGAFSSHDREEEVDLAAQLAEHLAEGSVAVIVEAGAEKLRYVHGHALAVNSRGVQVHLDLTDVYEKAERELGGEVTRAEY